MTWKEDKIEELVTRSAYVIELDARDPEDLDDMSERVDDRGVSAMMTSWEDKTTLVVESGIDVRGEPFLIASAYDDEGNAMAPDVMELGESVWVRASKIDTAATEQ